MEVSFQGTGNGIYYLMREAATDFPVTFSKLRETPPQRKQEAPPNVFSGAAQNLHKNAQRSQECCRHGKLPGKLLTLDIGWRCFCPTVNIIPCVQRAMVWLGLLKIYVQIIGFRLTSTSVTKAPQPFCRPSMLVYSVGNGTLTDVRAGKTHRMCWRSLHKPHSRI